MRPALQGIRTVVLAVANGKGNMGVFRRLVMISMCIMCCEALAQDELDFLDLDQEAELVAKVPESSSESSSEGKKPEVITLDADPVPQAAVRGRHREIEEIVVTAQKTEQTLAEVPVAVSVVGGDTLRNSGVFGAEGIENLVPNIELDSDAQAPSIGVRGFSTDSYNVGLEPSVGIVVDDIPLGRTEFIPDGLYDLDRVEVLRGPQGTLFGKNTIAGVLIFGTGVPKPEPGGSLLLTGEEEKDARLEVVLNQPITDDLLFRGAALGWTSSGEIRNTFLDRDELAFDQYAGRLKFQYDPSDRLQLRFGGQATDIRTNYANWQLYDLDADALEYAQSKDPATEDDPFNEQTSFDLPGFVNHTTDLFHIAADYALTEQLNVVAVAGHADLTADQLMDFDVSAADLVRVTVGFDYSQDSLEMRFTGNGSLFGRDLEYVGGLFGFQSAMDIAVDVSVGEDILDFVLSPAGAEALGAPDGGGLYELLGPVAGSVPAPGADLQDGVFQVFDNESQSIAAFGQITWFFADQLSAILGLRVGKEDKDATLAVTSRGLGITAFVLGANDPPNTDFVEPLRRRESEISPKLGLRYEWDRDLSIYGSWTRGYKSGGFNAISFNSENLEFEPEQGDNYELGMKTKLLDRSLALNSTVYRTDVTNMQVVSFNGVSFDVFNAEGATLQGLEMDLTWLTPLEWLSINGAFALASAEYKSYPNGPQTAEQSSNCDANTETCEQDLTGQTLPKAPRITASVSPTLSFPLTRKLGMVLASDISYRGEQYLTLDLDRKAYQDAQILIAARMSLGPADESWGITFRGTNLANEKALSFVADHNLYAHSYFATQIPERSFSITLSANW